MNKKLILAIVGSVLILAVSIKAYHMYANIHHKLDDILTNQSMQVIQDEQQEISDTEVDNISIREAIDMLDRQDKVDAELKEELKNKDYTLDAPLVIENPYSISPLTALILFHTDKPCTIILDINGQTGYEIDDIHVEFDEAGLSTEHIIPVYGLVPNCINDITLSASYEDGEVSKSKIQIKTEPLIDDLSKIVHITKLMQQEKYEPGFNFSAAGLHHNGIKNAFDSTGTVRWYFNQVFFATCTNYDQLDNGHILVKNNAADIDIIYEMDLLGRIYSIYYDESYSSHHYIELTDHNTMILPKTNSDNNQDCLAEIDLSTGEMIHFLDYKDIIPRSRDAGAVYDNFDWMHMNSAVEYQGDVIISSNYQSAIIRNDWDGTIKWILASPKKWYDIWQDKLLTPIGDDFEWPYNQHAVEVLDDYDDDPDTVDLLMFDNGLSRNYVDGTEDKELYSRLVHYRINEKDMTIEQIWEYGQDKPELYSRYRGKAAALDGGNCLGTFNQETEEGLPCDTIYAEVDNEKNLVWECYSASKLQDNAYQDYQLIRRPIYTKALYIDLEEDVRNFIPKEILSEFES